MSRFAKIQEALKPSAVETPNDAKVVPAPTDTSTDQSSIKDKEMPEDEAATAAIIAAAHADGVKAANDRMNAVFASEHYAGREAHAAKLLGKKNMSADDIIDVLADMPKLAPAAVDEAAVTAAAEAAARSEMATTIAQTGNSGVDSTDPVAAAPADKRAEADAVWAKARPLADKGVK